MEFNFGVFFHGPDAGIFGGIVWQTPIKSLSLIAEYSSDTYALENSSGNFRPKNQINLGASYEIFNGINIGLQWLHGEAVGGTLSFQLDPTKPQYPAKIQPEVPQPVIRAPEEQQVALETLLHERSMKIAPAPNGAPPGGEAQIGNLADALFRDGQNIDDVSIEGRLLRVSLDGRIHHA